MKAKLALVILLVAVVALVGVGCKATGGGWFTNMAVGETYGNRITFGFNAHLDVEDLTVKGQLQLIDHDAKTNIHGTFDSMTTAGEWVGTCIVKGEGMVNGDGPHPLKLFCVDAGEPGPGAGDLVDIYIGESSPWLYHYTGFLEGGNIQVHEDK